MPNRDDWPPGPRLLEHASRLLGYAAALTAGYGVLVSPGAEHALAIQMLGALAVAGGALCLAATLAHNWMLEMVAIWPILGAFAGYALLAWTVLNAGLATSAVVTFAVAATIGRIAQLWLFSLGNRRAKRDRARLWKKVADDELGGTA